MKCSNCKRDVSLKKDGSFYSYCDSCREVAKKNRNKNKQYKKDNNICTHCSHTVSQKEDGSFYSYCDICREIDKKSKLKRKDKIKVKNKKYQLENKEQIKVQRKEYYEENKDKIKQYIDVNKDKIRIANMNYNAKSEDIKYNRYDEENHVDKDFIINQIVLQHNECIYCNKIMNLGGKALNNDLCTIERIDNDIGHIKDNCVLACLNCNRKRNNTYSHNEFMCIKNNLVEPCM